MSFDPVYPIAGSHAVQSAAFAVEWNQSLTDTELQGVQARHEQIRKSLPHVGSNPAVSIALNPAGPVASQGIGSVVFSRPGIRLSSGPGRLLEVSKERCVGQINDYTRWKNVWGEVHDWFEIIIPDLVAAHPVKAVGLQYTDVFHWRADKKTFDVRKVLREGSPYLPANAFNVESLWHSNHGFLTTRETPSKHRLLENINVNLLDELGQLSLVISTMHRAEFDPVWDWKDVNAALNLLMPDLHERNKLILASVLNDETGKKINLHGKVGES